MSFERRSQLLKDISSMLNAEYYNVIIQVGENQDTKEFYAHSDILRARSQYFKNIIPADVLKKNIMFTINEPKITPANFEIILKYIYTGYLDLQIGADKLGLLIACVDLLFKELVEYLQSHYIYNSNWIKQNSVTILNSIFNLPDCKQLKDNCVESICRNPLPIFNSNDFLSLDKDILYHLLEQDDFPLRLNKEIIIWDYLIKWGIKQTPKLKNNQDEWIDENYEDLKDTLSNFIPLIKFNNITPEDFYDKVRPYKIIIPNNIYDEIMKYYLVEQPQSYTIYSSKIIKPNFINMIANWIDKKELSYPSIFIRTEDDSIYKFNLIYRGSRDGINNKSFYDKYSHRVECLFLIKVHKLDKIFGGYSTVGFNIHQYYNNLLDNFIFSFENNYDCQSMSVIRPTNDIHAYYSSGYFTSYCNAWYINDQFLYVNTSYGCHAIYEIEEIETYVVTKL
ncbi:hypothetical protein RclHR1_02220008 [Rhizophagus clarus]|nr:hypothetical protein RclHR1_02220008 [Rhizophagus clarus]